MPKLVDAIAPPRLGSAFRWLIGSQWVTNLGDGVALAAGPLLVEAETNSVALVGLSWLLGRLPWLLFGLHAGLIADRLDRRVVIVAANVARAAVLAVLSASIITDQVNITIILVSLFLLGMAEVFADVTSNTLLPMIVEKRDLTLGNSRIMFGHIGLNQLIGPPVGAALFTVGMWLPFGVQAIGVLLGAVLVKRIVLGPSAAEAGQGGGNTSPSHEIIEGIRWVWHNSAVRTLALAIFFFNVTFGGAISVLVVLATERLELTGFGFGMMTAMIALGGVLGTVLYRRTEARFGMVRIMRAGLMMEATTHLVLAVSTSAAVVFATLILFGVHESMWGTTSSSIRQAVVPNEFQGRVSSVYIMGLQTGLVVGAGLGALIAELFGITGPYWFGFIGTSIVLALIWRQLDSIAHAAIAETVPT
ncbi:MAG: MFS transporter [Acidimicrobiales bacterium]